MDSKKYLDDLRSNLASWSAGDSRPDISHTMNFAGTADELSTRDDIRREMIAWRFRPGQFGYNTGRNKPTEWAAEVELLIYVETSGGKIDRDKGYDRMLELFDMCIDWANSISPAGINSDIMEFFPIRHENIIDNKPSYFAVPLVFNANIQI